LRPLAEIALRHEPPTCTEAASARKNWNAAASHGLAERERDQAHRSHSLNQGNGPPQCQIARPPAEKPAGVPHPRRLWALHCSNSPVAAPEVSETAFGVAVLMRLGGRAADAGANRRVRASQVGRAGGWLAALKHRPRSVRP
jgi:hypothetical protein